MIYLIYASTAVRALGRDEFEELVAKWREYNIRHGITSMMLYGKGNMIQMLEGKEEAVRELFEKISKDPAHHDVIKITEGHLVKRVFENWPMGLMNLEDDDVRKSPCFQKIVNHPLFDSEENPECVACLDVLKGFIANP